MPQLTIKQVIASTLLRICREATNKVRPNEDANPRMYSNEQVDQIHAMLKSLGWSDDKILIQTHIYAALFNAPELNMPAMIPLEQFCVVVLEENVSGHAYDMEWPLIITNVDNRFCMHTDGVVNRWTFTTKDNPRMATDAEIKICIESLTDKQWKTITTADVFNPVMDAAMRQAVSVDIEPVKNGESEEHTLPDGRKITVDAG